ncbi:MAG: hypothetical protein HFH07_05000, partial [Dorea sp.]|nr:hypothetical protein [Dorea sp.]
ENAATDFRQGSITCIGEYSLTIGNLMGAVFRQMADNFIHAADVMEKDTFAIDRIIFSGGVARKIAKIRDYILEHYKSDVRTETVSDETFSGLYAYGQQEDVK